MLFRSCQFRFSTSAGWFNTSETTLASFEPGPWTAPRPSAEDAHSESSQVRQTRFGVTDKSYRTEWTEKTERMHLRPAISQFSGRTADNSARRCFRPLKSFIGSSVQDGIAADGINWRKGRLDRWRSRARPRRACGGRTEPLHHQAQRPQ